MPSTIVGRIRCDSAERNAPFWPESRVSMVMKPVIGLKKYMRSMRPDTGVQCSVPENTMISSSPHQKIGIE